LTEDQRANNMLTLSSS